MVVTLAMAAGLTGFPYGQSPADAAVWEKVGVYEGAANPAGVAQFEAWSGHQVHYVLDFLAADSWTAIESPDWWAKAWNGTGKQVVWSVPMLPRGTGTMAEGAQGAYDAHFVTLARRLVALGQGGSVIRPGWEMNGDWFAWSAKPSAATYAAYFRHIVSAMRSVPGAAFRFDWTPNIGGTFAVEDAYPGDAYVDYIGLDTYDQGWSDGWTDPVRRWDNAMNEPHGLRWHRDFARAHGKPMTFPEWGLFVRPDGHGGGDDPYYVEQMLNWIDTNDVAYALYFDFDAHDGQHDLQNPLFARAAAAFKARIGSASTAPAPAAAPSPAAVTASASTATSPTTAPAAQPRTSSGTTATRTPALPVATTRATDVGAPTGFSVATVDGRSTTYPSAASAGVRSAHPVVDVANRPKHEGRWLVASDGGVFGVGDAPFYGSTGAMRLTKPVVGVAATPSGNGYWLVASDGGIFSFGDARFLGSTGAMRLAKPVVDIAPTPSGKGYWLVASDGGIFSFGDARFFGSTGAMRLVKPIVDIAPTPTGNGYWLVASDGGIFSFGDARFFGSAAGRAPEGVVGMAATAGGGYWLLGAAGGVWSFGDATPVARASCSVGCAGIAAR
jgi:hypothetical protein